MPRNGSGTYTRVAGTPYVYNTVISETTVNSEMDDFATAITGSIAKDGQTTPTANLPMGTYRHTGVGNGSARTDYAAMGQVQDGKVNWVDGGGTADAITATYSPAITALVDGQLCFVRATAANATTTPTFAPNGLTARTIVKFGGQALIAGDIYGDGHELILRYDLTNTRWELLNPQYEIIPAKLVQSLTTTTANYVGLSTQIPLDNTIPQNTEGTEILTRAITPKNASSTIRVTARMSITSPAGSGGTFIAALFKDTGADAIAADRVYCGSGGIAQHIVVSYEEPAGSTAARTYKLRGGPSSAITMYYNGNDSSRLLGGVSIVSLNVQEILP